MTEPVIFKRSLSVAALTFVRAVTPTVIAVGMLYIIVMAADLTFHTRYLMLGALLVVIGPLILRLPPVEARQFVTLRWPTLAPLSIRWLLLLGILLAIGYVTQFSEGYARRVILTWAIVTPVPLILAMLALNRAMRRTLYSPQNARLAVFAGYNDVSVALAERLRKHPELCIRVDGFFDDRSAERLKPTHGGDLLGGLAELPEYVKSKAVAVIFIALPMRHVQRVLDLLDQLRDTTASIYYVPDVFVFDLIQSRTADLLGFPVVAMCETPFAGYRGVVKRVMDIVLGGIALVVLAPLLAVTALLVKFSSPGPILFRQRRYGLDGQEIQVYKFRTMTVLEDGPRVRQATRDDDRFTPIGRILRRYSIDEIPQLFNVLAGTMSLVGPRPHAVSHNEEYRKLIKGYMVRHKVLPGMTGLAQIHGCRGETAKLEQMEARVRYDLDYLRSWTPVLDLKILLKTVLVVFSDSKAY